MTAVVVAVAALGVALATGSGSGAALGVVGGLVVTLVLLRPAWALVALVVVEASNASSVLGAVGPVSPYLATLALATGALGLGVATGRLRLPRARVLLYAAVFAASQAVATLAARDGTLAWQASTALLKDLWLLVVVVALAAVVSDGWALARWFTVVLAALAGLSLVNQFLLGNATSFGGFSVVTDATGVGVATARHAGPLPDTNLWGRLLVLAIPLAVALAWRARQADAGRALVLWSGAALVLCGGLYLTQSRGSLIGLAAAVLVMLAVTSPRSRRALLLVPVIALVLAAVPGIGNRLGTLDQVTGALHGQGDGALVERIAAQQIALAMFTDDPVLGVGPGNIPAAWEQYDDEPTITVHREVAPHNLYLQIGAETGLVGLLGWTVFLGGALLTAARVWAAHPVTADGRAPPPRLLAVGAAAALVGWSVCSLFLHLSFWRPLLLVVAVLAVLDHQTAPRPAGALAGAVRSGLARAARPATVVRTVATLGAVAVVLSLALGQQAVARQTVSVQPAEGGPLYPDAYARSVLSRPSVLPTYATVVQQRADSRHQSPSQGVSAGPLANSGRYEVEVTGNSTDATLVVEARGPDQAEAAALASATAEDGAAAVNDIPGLHRLATATRAGSPTTGTGLVVRPDVLTRGALLVILGNLLVSRRAATTGRRAARKGWHALRVLTGEARLDADTEAEAQRGPDTTRQPGREGRR